MCREHPSEEKTGVPGAHFHLSEKGIRGHPPKVGYTSLAVVGPSEVESDLCEISGVRC